METSYRVYEGLEYLGIGGGFTLVKPEDQEHVSHIIRDGVFCMTRNYEESPQVFLGFKYADKIFNKCKRLRTSGKIVRLASAAEKAGFFDRLNVLSDKRLEYFFQNKDVKSFNDLLETVYLSAFGRYIEMLEAAADSTSPKS